MKISKSDYPVMATMKLSGSTWAEIGALYGVSAGHVRNLKSDIMKDTTIGDKFLRSSFDKMSSSKITSLSSTIINKRHGIRIIMIVLQIS